MPEGAPESSYVFISYASADRERVLPLVDRLEAAGVRTWIDREGIHGGANYAQEITDAIKQCAVLVLFCSAASLASRNIRQELALGWRFEKPYLPLLLEPVTVPDEVAYWLEAAQWIEVLERPEAEWLGEVATALRRHGITVSLRDDLPSRAPRVRPLLVGREREQATLRQHLEAMLSGRGSVVLVGGEAGIGKTTLVEDLSVLAEEAGALVLWGHAYDLSVTPPYGPWLEIFRQYRALAESALPPVPAFVFDADELAGVGSQETLFAGVADFFRAVAAQRPLLLTLDDLHWFDQASLDFFRYLARLVNTERMLLVVTYRSDELTRRHALYTLLPLVVREAGALRVDVRPLDEAGHGALIQSRYALAADDRDRLEQYLEDHAEGNPLYAGELLRTLEEERILVEQDDGWALGNLERARVPPLLRQVIDGRLRRLDADTRGLLQVGSVIGQEVPVDLWQRVSGADDQALITALEQGREAQLLQEEPGGEIWRFNHALIREALYEDLVSVRRRGVHRQVAEHMEGSMSPDPDVVAYHYQQAGDRRAVSWLLKAGERAERAYALVIAADRLETALTKLDEQGIPPVDRALLLWRIASLRRFQNPGQSVMLLTEARGLAIEAAERGLASRCLFRMGLFQCFEGHLRPGLAAMEQATAELRVLAGEESARLRILLGSDAGVSDGTLAGWLAASGRFQEAAALAERMLLNVSPSPTMTEEDLREVPNALIGLMLARAFQGAPLLARDAAHQAHAISQATEKFNYITSLCFAELDNIQLPYFPEEIEARTQLALMGDRAMERMSDGVAIQLPPRVVSLSLMVLEGNWAEAESAAVSTYPTILGPWVAARLAQVARNRGAVELARSVIGDLLPDGPVTEAGDTHFDAALPLQRTAVELALDVGDLPKARAWLEAHDRWLDWSGAILGRAEGALLWAQYHHASGDLVSSRASTEQALAHASDPRQPLALIAVHRFIGQLDTEEQRFDSAEERLNESLRLADACAAPFERALTLLEIAKLRMAQDRTDEARTLLAEARSICEPLEAKPTLERVAALERQLGAGAGAD